MTDTCNHTSVGVLAERDGRFLLFQRQKYPYAKAPCAGHVDEFPGVPNGSLHGEAEGIYRTAAARELEEETGLTVNLLDLHGVLTSSTFNKCRRPTVDGDRPWHYWRVYRVSIPHGQNPHGNGTESDDLRWYTPDEIRALPDLEPVWRDHLRQIRII